MAQDVEAQVIEFRRDLHMHPETCFEEFRTTEKIAEQLDSLGIPYRKFEPTGLIAEIKGGKPGKTVALRADIDALTIQEQTDLPFKSVKDGYMHACGHDTHAAMLIGAAMVLNSIKDELPGTVKLIFQPAEEICAGARAVIKQGALDGVDAIFGLHIGGQVPVGVIAYVPGAACSAADMFKIKVTGQAGHGAMPEASIDATVAAAAIVMNLQTMVSRELPPTQPVVCTVGTLNSGSRFNIVSGSATMEGTCRCYDKEIHRRIPEIMERIVKQTAAAYRCTAEFEYEVHTEVLVNNPDALEILKGAALKVVAVPQMLVEAKPIMGAEDFAEYAAVIPGAFCFIGGGGTLPNHNDHIVFDEAAFKTGIALHAQMAYDFLTK